MPSIIAGGLTLQDIALHAVTQGELYMVSTSGGDWDPNVWEDLPVTIAVDVPEGAKALAVFNSSMQTRTQHWFSLRNVIDGVAYPEASITPDEYWSNRYTPATTFAFVTDLAAGTHVFKVQARAGYVTSNAYWRNLRHVVAILKR